MVARVIAGSQAPVLQVIHPSFHQEMHYIVGEEDLRCDERRYLCFVREEELGQD